MDDNVKNNQGTQNPLSVLEQELEVLKGKAAKEYKNKQTLSPIRTVAEKMAVPADKKPTYLEETQLGKTLKVETSISAPKPGASKTIFWVGIGLLVFAIVVALAYLLLQTI